MHRTPSAPGRLTAALLLTGLCACGGSPGGHAQPGSAPAAGSTPEREPFDAESALAEIAAYPPEPGETRDVVEVRDERGELGLRREVLRDADGMLNHGHFQRWHPNGQQAEDGHYFKGARHGVYTVIAETGLKLTEQTFEHGVKQGVSLTWSELGKLKERAHYLDGVLEGEFETFYHEGPGSRGSYRAGVEEGLWTWWYVEGGKEREGRFERGKKVGKWTFWRISGILKGEEHYVDGVLEGTVVEYGPEEVKLAERSFRAGVLDGLSVEYYPDGTERSRIEYARGVPHGHQTRWYEGGGLQMEGEMDEGRRVGPWVYYKLDGSRNEAWSGTYEADVRVGD